MVQQILRVLRGDIFTFQRITGPDTEFNGDADGSGVYAEFRQIDASKITRNIEAVQKKINTGRVQAGSQYAALESAVIYTTDLTAQYELGYNTVHDVNFSMETAHIWQRTKSYSRPRLPCWRKPIRDSRVFCS